MRGVSSVALVLLGWPYCGALVACGSNDESRTVANQSGAAGVTEGSGSSDAVGAAGDPSNSTGGRAEAAGGAQPSGGRVEVAFGGRSTSSEGEGAGGATGGSRNGERGGSDTAGSSPLGNLGGGGAASGQEGQGTGCREETAGGASGGSPMAEPSDGGGAVGQAGQNAAGSADVEGIPGVSSFTSFTIRSQAAMVWSLEPDAECDQACYESAWTLDRASKTLTWDWCNGDPGVIERGSGSLSDAKFQATRNALSLVTLSAEGRCLADADAVELELEVDGTTTLHHDDYGWCGAGPNDSNYASGLDALQHWLEWLSGVEVPETPETLTVSTGDPPQDPPADSDCLAHFRPREYDIDVASGALSWYSCATDAETGEYVLTTEGRVLNAAELESVLAAYHQLELGATGSCESLVAPNHLSASVTMNDTLYLFDESGEKALSGVE